MRDEVRQQATHINRQRGYFSAASHRIMDMVGLKDSQARADRRKGDAQGSGKAWVDEVCTFKTFQAALNKIKISTGVGIDGWSAYLLRKAPAEVQQGYWRDLTLCIARQRFPAEYTEWIALLAMKPGEDPRELSRRRDLWLVPACPSLYAHADDHERWWRGS